MAKNPVNRQTILENLKKCLDPELGIDIVNLGLIYDIDIQKNKVVITMTLTTPGCPLVPYFREDIEQKVKEVGSVGDVDIVLSFDPPWDPSKMSDIAKQQLSMIR